MTFGDFANFPARCFQYLLQTMFPLCRCRRYFPYVFRCRRCFRYVAADDTSHIYFAADDTSHIYVAVDDVSNILLHTVLSIFAAGDVCHILQQTIFAADDICCRRYFPYFTADDVSHIEVQTILPY